MFSYNNQGYLSTIKYIDFRSTELKLETDKYGNVTKIILNDGVSSVDIKYWDIPDKSGINYLLSELIYMEENGNTVTYNIFDVFDVLYQFGYYGKKSKNLISEIGGAKYAYKLDEDGYVTTMFKLGLESDELQSETRFYYDK